jgi:hypothetical protein
MERVEFLLAVIAVLLFVLVIQVSGIAKRTRERSPTERNRITTGPTMTLWAIGKRIRTTRSSRPEDKPNRRMSEELTGKSSKFI